MKPAEIKLTAAFWNDVWELLWGPDAEPGYYTAGSWYWVAGQGGGWQQTLAYWLSDGEIDTYSNEAPISADGSTPYYGYMGEPWQSDFPQEQGTLLAGDPSGFAWEQRSGKAAWALHAGGLDVAAKNLTDIFRLSAVAQEEVAGLGQGLTGGSIVAGATVPGPETMELGQAESTHHFALVQVAAGTTLDAPLAAAAPLHDDRSTIAGEYQPHITANGTDIVTNVANFCVGQEVVFQLTGLPNGVVATNIHWVFGGTYFNTQSNAVAGMMWPNCSTVPYVDSSLLSNSVVTNWWVSGGANNDANTPASYTSVATGTLLSAHGHTAQAFSVSGGFNMYRPQARITTRTGTISIDSNDFIITNGIDGSNVFALHFGIPSSTNGIYSSNGPPGIVFTASETYPTNYIGNVAYIQVVNFALNKLCAPNSDSAWYPALSVPIPALDCFMPVGPTNEDAPMQAANPPSNFQGVSCENNFSTYLMFKLNADAHFVPLRRVDWSWSALAALSESGTNWELVRATNTINPTDSNCIRYPYWILNATNIMH